MSIIVGSIVGLLLAVLIPWVAVSIHSRILRRRPAGNPSLQKEQLAYRPPAPVPGIGDVARPAPIRVQIDPPRGCVFHSFRETCEICGHPEYSRQHPARLLHLYPLSGLDYRPVSDRERLMYPLPEPSRATERAMGRLTLMEHLLRAVEGPTEPQAEPEEPALEFLYYR